MSDFLYFIIVVFLVLVQVTFLPLNLAFLLIWGLSSFEVKKNFVLWLVILSVFFSFFSNLNLGFVLLSFGTSFFALNLLATILPQNNVIRWSLIALSLFVSESSFLLYNIVLR